MRRLQSNCHNCGAALVNGKCEYCGTTVRWANEIDILLNDWGTEPIELSLNLKKGTNTYILPLIGHIDNINISDDSVNAVDALGHIIKTFVISRNVDFTFSGRFQE